VNFTTTYTPYQELRQDSAAHTQAEPEKPGIFTELLHHTQDAHEIELPPQIHVDLPYILIDRGTLTTYRSTEQLEQGGMYTIQENHVIRATGGGKPDLDLSITKHVVFLWLAALLLFVVAVGAARKLRASMVPSGFANLFEVFVVYVRDEIVIPNMGPEGLRYLPYLLTTFFFILIMNLMGMIPYGATPTGNVNVTAGLAIIAFIMIQVSAIRAQGFGHYLKHLTGGVHWALWPIMVPIEILGLFTKPFALCIRLFANMSGGHIVVVALLGLIFLFKSWFIAPAPIAFVIGINMLELFVAFLQAYIFTMLTSLFMGLGIQAAHEGHEAHEEHAH